ncbi:MAG: Stf0 family sulfotransferase [Bacteroidota bacterium]
MQPTKFYALWFSQRNGSTLLCKALEMTNVLGKPAELFTIGPAEKLLTKHKAVDYAQLQAKVYEMGSSPNGVFGIKLNAPQKNNDPIINELKLFPVAQAASNLTTNFAVWETVFPACKHIFLTRRNKVRQAVSWWKAIMTNEWHREIGGLAKVNDAAISNKYDFNAIKHLLTETTIRESKIQAFLEEGKAAALTIVYEDFIRDYTGTIKRIGQYLGEDIDEAHIALPYYAKLADEISDEWTERFRVELQKDWTNKVW